MAVDYDVLVIGAGVVGLAVAREAALRGFTTLILERHDAIGTETSSRNSEVVHAGIYYPPGSLKASCCRLGAERLYRYAESAQVPYRRCGKVIVATSDAEVPALSDIAARASASYVNELRMLDRGEVAALEPALRSRAALFSPNTGIIDSHALMQAYLGEAEAHGAELVLGATVSRLDQRGSEWCLSIMGEADPVLTCRRVINAAGLSAVDLAGCFEGYTRPNPHQAYFAKGTYYSYAGRVPFSRLVYPVPEVGGLGIHLTLDLAGRARFGPNVEWIAAPDYTVTGDDRDQFAEAIRTYWPEVDIMGLQPEYAGVRPKLSGPNDPASDFLIEGPSDHGLPGVVNLLGIESPGLTSSLVLAEMAMDEAAPDSAKSPSESTPI